MDLFKETLEIFKERKFLKADLIVPTYICSIGCHMFNFMNKHKKIYWEGDIIPDTRLHIFMITIPGYGKTYLINQFISKYNGLLIDSDIRTSKIGEITAAGLVGTVKTTPDGNVVVNKGTFQRKSDAIICSDEFSNVTSSAKTSHSANLINHLLSGLDDGIINKDQGGGGLEYETFSSVWGATQPGRFELKAGLPRRFAFVIYMPDAQDAFMFRNIRDETKDLRIDKKRLLEYKLGINARFKEVKTNLKKIVFSDEYKKWIKTFFATHYEDIIFEKILLGYWIMKSHTIGETLVLELNDEVKEIIKQQIDTRLRVQKGVEKIKIMDVLKHIKRMKYEDFVKLLLSFTLEEKYITRGMETLVANKLIRIEDGYVVNLKYKE